MKINFEEMFNDHRKYDKVIENGTEWKQFKY